MLSVRPFGSIAPGEIDNFAIDFAADVGLAEILETSWTSRLLPFQPGTDPTPGSHILSVMAVGIVQQTSRLRGAAIETRMGKFSVAEVGRFPESAVGCWYALEATLVLNDGRVLKGGGHLLCSWSGR
jgi:hypothetical protein